MPIELVHIGFGNILAMNRLIAIAPPGSAPIKRVIQESRSKGLLIDMMCLLWQQYLERNLILPHKEIPNYMFRLKPC